MADKSAIEWTDASWTPNEKMLLAPLRWRKPRLIFVCSMTDLFADFALDEWIDRVFAVMALAPQHTFQVLTKRAKRMRTYFDGTADQTRRSIIVGAVFGLSQSLGAKFTDEQCRIRNDRWPLPNVWLGVSAERQQEADERIPHLLATPAAVRFVSAEPLLGRINLDKWLQRCPRSQRVDGPLHTWRFDGDDPYVVCHWCGERRSTTANIVYGPRFTEQPRLNWVIAGGESGPRARPMHPDWARSLRDQCADADVPFFLKQNGEYLMAGDAMLRVGKKAAGRLLDGREHNAMPSVHGCER